MITAGVIGWPVAHSKSPLIHRFWLTKLGLDGDYSRFAVHPDHLGAALRALPALGVRGVNVTVPHKVAVLDYLDASDDRVKDSGAANCIEVRADGSLGGSNTDVAGVGACLANLPLAGAHAVVIGAGGAARAAIVGLMETGIGHVTLLNRSRDNALGAVRDTGIAARATVAGLDAVLPGDAALVVNASTLGMRGQPPLRVDLSPLAAATVIFDMVYAPLATSLLLAARARGLRTIDGLEMLVGQAAAAFELFFEAAAPREYDAELRALLTA